MRHRFRTLAVTAVVLGACSGSVRDRSSTDGVVPPGSTSGGTPVATVGGGGPGDGVTNGWSNPAVWGGKVPDGTSDVKIGKGTSVVLDKSTCVGSLTIEGELSFADQDLELCARWILVHAGGRLRIGSPSQPFEHRATITLSAPDPDEDVVGMGTKFLAAMDGGTLDIHGGGPRTAWTKLARPVNPGDTTIVVDDAAGWSAGDEIIVTSDTTEPHELEVFTIGKIDGKTLTLDKPLTHARAGTVKTLEGRTFDERAEVGVLSRRVVVQGDTQSDVSRFGGHTMIMAGGKAFVEGVEFVRMGQFERLGHYPFHWHIAGRSDGQYIKRSVVKAGYQRGFVVHSTNGVTVADNIAFDTTGHNFIVETSVTTGNVFDHNLAANNKLGLFANPDIVPQHDAQAAGFWIRSADNTFTNNAVAGSESNGFWFDSVENVQTVFEHNSIHSVAGRGTRADFVRDSGLQVQTTDAAKNGPSLTTLRSSLLFANGTTSIWPHKGAQIYEDFIIDSPVAGTVSEGVASTFKNTLFLGKGNALVIQYLGKVTAVDSTFVGCGMLFGSDIATDPLADISIKGGKFVDVAKASMSPMENGVFEALDDSYLPKGFYVPGDPSDAAIVPPGAVKIMAPDEGGDVPFYYRSDRRYRIGKLTVGLETTSPTFDPNVTIRRSDGARYNDTGSGNNGYRLLLDDSLRYEFEGMPNSAKLFVYLQTFDFGYPSDPPKATVEIALPRSAQPKEVSTVEGDISRDYSFKPMQRAASLDDFRASPAGRYYYDDGKKLLYLQADNQVWKHIE